MKFKVNVSGIKKYWPTLLLAIWISATGHFIWQRAHESHQPPIYDQIQYIQKAKASWENLRNGFPQNPFNVKPALRPPGTVLVTYPFGYTDDYQAFYFRSLFLPFVIWTFSVLIVFWPLGAGFKSSDILKAVLAALCLGPMPMFLQFEFPATICWGYMDIFLGATAGLAIATMGRGMLNRSWPWILLSICTATLSVMIKPSGSLVLLATGIYFTCWEGLHLIREKRLGNPLNLKLAVFGLLGFAIIGGGVSAICIQSAYIGMENRAFMGKSMLVIQDLTSMSSTWQYLKKGYVFLGPHGVLVSAGSCLVAAAVILLPRKLTPKNAITFNLIFGLAIIIFGLYFWQKRTGMSEVRYFAPFACMGLSAILLAIRPILIHVRPIGLRAMGIILCILPAINFLLLAAIKNPDARWQRFSGVEVSIAETESAALKMGKWLGEKAQMSASNPNVYMIGLNKSFIEFECHSIFEAFRHPDIHYYTCTQQIDWLEKTTYDLKTMLGKSDFILHGIPDSNSLKTLLSEKKGGHYNLETVLLNAFLSSLKDDESISVAYTTNEFRLISIRSTERFIQRFDSTLAGVDWSPEFRQRNNIRNGRFRLHDEASERLSYGDATEAPDGYQGSIERIDGTNIQANTMTVGRTMQVEGWLAANAIKGIPSEETFLTIDRPGHPTVFVSTHRTYRFDVSKIFGHERLERSGFTATAEMSGMQGICRLGLAMVFEGKLMRCPAFKVMLRVQ